MKLSGATVITEAVTQNILLPSFPGIRLQTCLEIFLHSETKRKLHHIDGHAHVDNIYRPQSREIMYLVASIRTSVCRLPFSWLNRLTYGHDIWYVG